MSKINFAGYWFFLLPIGYIIFTLWSNFDPGQRDRLLRVLDVQGYKQAKLTGYSFIGCAEDDIQRFGFEAELNGRSVQGYICGGALKGYTTRLR
jgi:hypothetical protein